jgi:hypothetical protein
VDDEASLALAFGAIGTRLSFLLLTQVLPKLLGAIVLVSLGIVVTSFVFDFEATTTSQMLRTAAFTIGIGLLFFVLVPGIFKSIFGREFLIGALRCDVSADSVSDADGEIRVTTLPPPAGHRLFGVRHFIYSYPECVGAIVDWIVRHKIKNPSAPAVKRETEEDWA